MIAVAIYVNTFVCFWYFVVKQMSFIVLKPAMLGPVRNWWTKNLGLIEIVLV